MPPPSPRRRRPAHENPKSVGEPRPRSPGAWLPWPTVEKVCRLDLRPPSVWRVFLAVLLTAARFGGREARLDVGALAGMTGLSRRTVKAALARLLERGLLARRGRYGVLMVTFGAEGDGSGGAGTPAPRGGDAPNPGGADELAPPRCRQACPSPTSVNVFHSEDSTGPFSRKQQGVIQDVLNEATELLGSDAAELPLPNEAAARFGLAVGTTYRRAWQTLTAAGSGADARDFVKAVLALREDARVQGEELELG
jgi:hypothetical protein